MFLKLFLCYCLLFCLLAAETEDKVKDKDQPKEDIDRIVTKEEEQESDTIITQMDNTTPSSHILMFHPWNTKSHRIQQNALLEGFLARGHRVTGVFPQSSNIKNERYTEIVVEDG